MTRRTKIICTIGPASDDPGTLRDMIRAGMDVARIGMAHASIEEGIERCRRIRAAAADVGRPVGVLVDLPGPLRIEIALHLNRSILEKVPLFTSGSEAFFQELVLYLQPGVFLPGQTLMRRGEVGDQHCHTGYSVSCQLTASIESKPSDPEHASTNN